MATQKSATTAGAPAAGEPASEVPFDELVSGRLALQTLQAQLDQQADTLRAQLAINRAHRRETEGMLRKVDSKLAKQHAALYKLLTLD